MWRYEYLHCDFISPRLDLALGNLWGDGGYLITKTMKKAREIFIQFQCSMITGHSLGGYAATIFAIHNSVPGVAFCAPGVNGPVQKFGGPITQGFPIVRFEKDMVGNIYDHDQPMIIVDLGDSAEHHSMAQMTDFWERKNDITNQDYQNKIRHDGKVYRIS